MSDKRNEILASEWQKTLTEEQLNTYVHLRDNWGDVVVSGKLHNMFKNHWIEPFNGIDIDKTNVDGGDVYLGTIQLGRKSEEYIKGYEQGVTDLSERLKKYYWMLGGKTNSAVVSYHVEQIVKELKEKV